MNDLEHALNEGERMKTTKESLLKAAALLETPGAWTTGFCARDATDCPVPSNDPLAVKWCALGAIAKVVPLVEDDPDPDHDQDYYRCIRAIDAALFGVDVGDSIAEWNDRSTQETVVATLRKAADIQPKPW